MKRSAPMKRSAFKRKLTERQPREERRELFGLPAPTQEELADQLVRVHFGRYGSNEVHAPQPKEAVKAKPGKRAPTVEEARWMAKIVAYGCIACRMDGWPSLTSFTRAPAVHHILRGGRRIGHLFTLPLCDPGHHQGGEAFGMVSRHPWKARFEAKYGTEMELLEKLRGSLALAKGKK